MKIIARLLGVALIIAGLAYGSVAVLMLVNLDETARLLESMGATKRDEFGFTSITAWKESVNLTSWFYLALGLASCVCGVGIVKFKEWARVSWLVVSLVLVALFVYLASLNPEWWSRYVELLLLAIPSLVVLSRKFRTAENAI